MANKKTTDYNTDLEDTLNIAFSGKARVDFGEDGSVVVRVGDIGVSFNKTTSGADAEKVVARLKDEIVRKFIKGA